MEEGKLISYREFLGNLDSHGGVEEFSDLVTVESGSCDGCIFDEVFQGCSGTLCNGEERKDGKTVIFIKKEPLQQSEHKYETMTGLQESASKMYDLQQREDEMGAEGTLEDYQILRKALHTLVERGKVYDPSGNEKERSMPQIVEMFNLMTGKDLTEQEGYMFMIALKLVRFCGTGYTHQDSLLDMVCYQALLDDCNSKENKDANSNNTKTEG